MPLVTKFSNGKIRKVVVSITFQLEFLERSGNRDYSRRSSHKRMASMIKKNSLSNAFPFIFDSCMRPILLRKEWESKTGRKWLSLHFTCKQNLKSRSFFAPKANENACYAGYVWFNIREIATQRGLKGRSPKSARSLTDLFYKTKGSTALVCSQLSQRTTPARPAQSFCFREVFALTRVRTKWKKGKKVEK